MSNWYPSAKRNKATASGGSFIGSTRIGVLHTTESYSFTPSSSSYYGHNNWPHFTVELNDTGNVYQHLPINIAARALANRPEGVETNREGCIQVEIVARAADARNWSTTPSAGLTRLRQLMRWIEANTLIPRKSSVRFGGNEQYGIRNLYELWPNQWVRYAGWLGHQHVPENSHWDPGSVDIDSLLSGDNVAISDEDVEQIVNELLRRRIPVTNPFKNEVELKPISTILRHSWERQARGMMDNDEMIALMQHFVNKQEE